MFTVFITGATSGLGRATARELAQRGAHVVVGGRRPDAVGAEVAELQARGGSASGFTADLSDLGALARALDGADLPRLDAIVANAGVTLTRPQKSAEGYELTFAVNVLAHHLLVSRLADHLQPNARVVFVSSGTQIPEHRLARRFGIPAPRWVGAQALARPDQAPEDKRLNNLQQAYSTSKLGNVLQARAYRQAFLALGRDVDVFAIDPGLMPETHLAREAPALARWIFQRVGRLAIPFVEGMRRVQTSADHLAKLALGEAHAGAGFLYLDGLEPYPASEDGLNDTYRNALYTDANRLVGLSEGNTIMPREIAPT